MDRGALWATVHVGLQRVLDTTEVTCNLLFLIYEMMWLNWDHYEGSFYVVTLYIWLFVLGLARGLGSEHLLFPFASIICFLVDNLNIWWLQECKVTSYNLYWHTCHFPLCFINRTEKVYHKVPFWFKLPNSKWSGVSYYYVPMSALKIICFII